MYVIGTSPQVSTVGTLLQVIIFALCFTVVKNHSLIYRKIRVFIAKTGFLKNWFHLCGTMPLMGCIFFNFLSIIAEVFLVSLLINMHLWIFWFIIQQNHNTFWGSFILKDFMSLGSENLSLSSNAMLISKRYWIPSCRN